MEKFIYMLSAFGVAFLLGMLYVVLDQQQHSKLVEFVLICLGMISIVVMAKSVDKV